MIKLTKKFLQLFLHGCPDGRVHDGVDDGIEERVCITWAVSSERIESRSDHRDIYQARSRSPPGCSLWRNLQCPNWRGRERTWERRGTSRRGRWGRWCQPSGWFFSAETPPASPVSWLSSSPPGHLHPPPSSSPAPLCLRIFWDWA